MQADDATVAHVLDICKRTEGGRGFTLSEVIVRIMSERPDLALSFSNAWGTLIRTKKIRMMKWAEPPGYRVAESREW
jgi:hypothetical protein